MTKTIIGSRKLRFLRYNIEILKGIDDVKSSMPFLIERKDVEKDSIKSDKRIFERADFNGILQRLLLD